MSRTPKAPRASSGVSSLRTSPAHRLMGSPPGLSFNTTLDRVESRQVYAGSLDVSLLEKSPARSQMWQSPKSLIHFGDLLNGSGISEALEEAERLRLQNIIIRSAEKRLCWAEFRDIKRQNQLEQSSQLSEELQIRRLQGNRSKAEAENAARQQREEEVTWRQKQAQEEKRARALKRAEEWARNQDDLQRSVGPT